MMRLNLSPRGLYVAIVIAALVLIFLYLLWVDVVRPRKERRLHEGYGYLRSPNEVREIRRYDGTSWVPQGLKRVEIPIKDLVEVDNPRSYVLSKLYVAGFDTSKPIVWWDDMTKGSRVFTQTMENERPPAVIKADPDLLMEFKGGPDGIEVTNGIDETPAGRDQQTGERKDSVWRSGKW